MLISLRAQISTRAAGCVPPAPVTLLQSNETRNRLDSFGVCVCVIGTRQTRQRLARWNWKRKLETENSSQLGTLFLQFSGSPTLFLFIFRPFHLSQMHQIWTQTHTNTHTHMELAGSYLPFFSTCLSIYPRSFSFERAG